MRQSANRGLLLVGLLRVLVPLRVDGLAGLALADFDVWFGRLGLDRVEDQLGRVLRQGSLDGCLVGLVGQGNLDVPRGKPTLDDLPDQEYPAGELSLRESGGNVSELDSLRLRLGRTLLGHGC